ncbi:MAG: prepilin-type N-terminal cleavage/methylation domain-containing protein, partial [Candidatus Margulisiibacteriota bacterium]
MKDKGFTIIELIIVL